MIAIENTLMEEIYTHVRQVYPHECCGMLIGEKSSNKVMEVHAVKNLNTQRAHDRYEMDPQDYQRIEEHARSNGFSILGFYHSHPDHPSAPSEFDTQAAWGAYQFTQELYSYIIVAVEGGDKVQATSWILNDKGVFEEEQILNAV